MSTTKYCGFQTLQKGNSKSNRIRSCQKAAGIDYGKWYNDKVVFAYDYMDGDDNIKEKDHDSHGMHVTGIATGNPDKKLGMATTYMELLQKPK